MALTESLASSPEEKSWVTKARGMFYTHRSICQLEPLNDVNKTKALIQ